MEMLDIYKNSSVYNIIKKDIDNNMVSHAYILTSDDYDLINTYSKYVAKQLLCGSDICNSCSNCVKIEHNTHTDVLVYPKEDQKQILVNDIMEIIDSSFVRSGEGYKIFILNNFEKCLPQAQNKFLKTLEEPSDGVVFIILTLDIKSVLKTITSRCKVINVPNLKVEELSQIADALNINTSLNAKEIALNAGN